MSVPGILLVDDDEDVLVLARALVEKAEPRAMIFTAIGANEAMRFLLGAIDSSDGAKRLPNVILLDLHMPGVDGFAFLRWVRCNPSLAAVKVVILSSSEAAEDFKKASVLGADGYLIKYPHPACFASLLKEAVHCPDAT